VEPGAGAWGEVQRARARRRRSGLDWAQLLCVPWVELRGTDPTLRAALASLNDRRVVVVASDRHARDGRHAPSGYRLAQRAIALASRLRLPVITFVDTPGADPGAESEADGVAREIARTFAAMDALPAPSVSLVVGEGGSGGALALAYSDRLLMLQHSVFSVIAPEGAAAILERDASKAPELAERLRLTSADLLALGIVDAVVTEDSDSIGTALGGALATAQQGERRQRFDVATRRWLR
jgi:acetyl-CoA carboxylase carboxyl transferase subunit beta